MKKLALLLLCLTLLLSAACAPKEEPTPTAAPSPETEAPATAAPEQTPDPVVTVVTPEPDDVPTIPPTEEPTEEPTEAPATPYAPDLSLLPIEFPIDEYRQEGNLITFDIDFDGEPDTISFAVNEETNRATVFMNDAPFEFDYGNNFDRIIFIDLDPATPYANILIVIDMASSDYLTMEVHPENGALVKGVEKEDLVTLREDGVLLSHERTDLLGTKTGTRPVSGEDLTPDSEWLDCRELTKSDLTTDRKESIEYGWLLHASRKIKCSIDGKATEIKKGSYVYMKRYHESERLVEVYTEDGEVALISVDYDPKEYTFTINGYPQDKVFDNIFYAD